MKKNKERYDFFLNGKDIHVRIEGEGAVEQTM